MKKILIILFMMLFLTGIVFADPIPGLGGGTYTPPIDPGFLPGYIPTPSTPPGSNDTDCSEFVLPRESDTPFHKYECVKIYPILFGKIDTQVDNMSVDLNYDDQSTTFSIFGKSGTSYGAINFISGREEFNFYVNIVPTVASYNKSLNTNYRFISNISLPNRQNNLRIIFPFSLYR